MGRAFGLISMVVSLALVAIFWATSMQSNGPTSSSTKKAERDATAAVSSLNFSAASTELEAFHAENGTYAGAAIAAELRRHARPGGCGVVLPAVGRRHARCSTSPARAAPPLPVPASDNPDVTLRGGGGV